ncbi:MAG: hypothetical protein QOE87_77, partial [Gaiellales bacterium]|nr:hypothetical protein [Gaiellales bacterium]
MPGTLATTARQFNARPEDVPKDWHAAGRVQDPRRACASGTPKGSKQALSVRDGRIKVSIARIKSGALPGLSGVL